jgi:hypothetical protein
MSATMNGESAGPQHRGTVRGGKRNYFGDGTAPPRSTFREPVRAIEERGKEWIAAHTA